MDNEKLKLINNKYEQVKKMKDVVKNIDNLNDFSLRGDGGYYIYLSDYEKNLFKTIVLADRKMQLEQLEKEFAEM